MGDVYYCRPDGNIVPVTKPRGKSWYSQVRRSSKFCKWCGKKLTLGGNLLSRATVDHIMPRAHGGPNTRGNTKVSCAWCNEGRAAVDHCYLTLICIADIVGRKMRPSISAIARYYNQSVERDRGAVAPLSISSADPA